MTRSETYLNFIPTAMRKLGWVLFVSMGVAGCATTGVPLPDNWNPPPMQATRAVALFEGVCGASLPDFKSATSRMQANGVVAASPHGTATVYSLDENVSFQLGKHSSTQKYCSIVFGTQDSLTKTRSAVKRLGDFNAFDAGYLAAYKDTEALVIFPNKTSNLNGVTYYNLRMVSEQ